MSEIISTRSPRSGRSSAEDFAGAGGYRPGLVRRADAGSAAHGLGMGAATPRADLAGLGRAGPLPDCADALHAGHSGRALARRSLPPRGVYEGGAGGCHGRREQLDRLRDPPGAGADAGGPADGRAGQTELAPEDRSADRGERGAPQAGAAGALTGLRQHHAVERVSGRHPDHDRRQLGGGAAFDPGPLHLARRGRRLSGLGRRGRRSGNAGGSPFAHFRPSPEGAADLDADGEGLLAHRARVRGLRPTAVLRAVPPLRACTGAGFRAAQMGEGQARDGGLSL